MAESPATVESGRSAVSRLATSCPAASDWLTRAMADYVDNAYPLLGAWDGFRALVASCAGHMATAPLRIVSAEDLERGMLDQREAFVAYHDGIDGYPGGYVAGNGGVGPLRRAMLCETAAEASGYASGRPHVIVRVSLRIEEIVPSPSTCGAGTLRSIFAQRERDELGAALDQAADASPAPIVKPANPPRARAKTKYRL